MSITDLVYDVFVVVDVLLEIENRVDVFHGVVDRRTCIFVVFPLRQHNLSPPPPHIHSPISQSVNRSIFRFLLLELRQNVEETFAVIGMLRNRV